MPGQKMGTSFKMAPIICPQCHHDVIVGRVRYQQSDDTYYADQEELYDGGESEAPRQEEVKQAVAELQQWVEPVDTETREQQPKRKWFRL